MKSIDYPESISALLDAFKLLPGVGQRGAERLLGWSLGNKRFHATLLAQTLLKTLQQTELCPRCGFYAQNGDCPACNAERQGRNPLLYCVVEHPGDVISIESSGAFDGCYHCLGGCLSPLDNIEPQNLRIDSLKQRIMEARQDQAQGEIELILALGSNVEADTTCLYLSAELAACGCRISRLAQGLPAGSGLAQTDSMTLQRALSGRTDFHG